MEYYMQVLKKYAVFEGRATRSEYWYFILFQLIIMLVLFSGIFFTMFSSQSFVPKFALGLIIFAYVLGTLIPSISVTVRRLHDIGKSGWWYLISFIPFGGIVLFVFTLLDSEPGENMYGPNPKERVSMPEMQIPPVSPMN